MVRYLMFFVFFVGCLSVMYKHVYSQQPFLSFSSVYEDIELLNDVQLKRDKESVLSKIDSLLIVANQDTSLQVIKTDFIYINSYLSRREYETKLSSKNPDNASFYIESTTNFIYSNKFESCTSNEIVNEKGLTSIKLCRLSLNENGLINSGTIIDLDRYLNMPDSTCLEHCKDNKFIRNDGIKKILSNDGSIAFYNLLAKRDERYLFRTSAIAMFFDQNRGFPILKRPLLQRKDFFIHMEKDYGRLRLKGEKKDLFFQAYNDNRITFRIERKTGRVVSAYKVNYLNREPYLLTYFRFHYYSDSLVIESFKVDIQDSKYKSIILPFFTVFNLDNTSDLEKMDRQLQKELTRFMTEKETIRFQKDGNITCYHRMNIDESKGQSLEVKVNYVYKGGLLSHISEERKNKNSYLKKSTSIAYNK